MRGNSRENSELDFYCLQKLPLSCAEQKDSEVKLLDFILVMNGSNATAQPFTCSPSVKEADGTA